MAKKLERACFCRDHGHLMAHAEGGKGKSNKFKVTFKPEMVLSSKSDMKDLGKWLLAASEQGE